MEPGARPISIGSLCKLAGLGPSAVYQITEQGTCRQSTVVRLARALTWIENDQVVIKRRGPLRAEVTIREPRPPQRTVTQIEMTKQGPRLRFVAQNPNVFPDFK